MLPTRCIIFTAEYDKQGSFIKGVSLRRIKPSEDKHPVVKYKLTMHDPDPTAGFWLVDPQQKGKYHQDARMRQAPKSGYVRELVFGSKQEYQQGTFYVKSGNQYGKGRVNNYTQDSRNGNMRCLLSVRMQEDGSRDLEIPGWLALPPRMPSASELSKAASANLPCCKPDQR